MNEKILKNLHIKNTTEKAFLVKNNNNCHSYKTLENHYLINKTLKTSNNHIKFSDSINSIDSLRNENFSIEQKKSLNIKKPIPPGPNSKIKNKIILGKGKFPNYSVGNGINKK